MSLPADENPIIPKCPGQLRNSVRFASSNEDFTDKQTAKNTSSGFSGCIYASALQNSNASISSDVTSETAIHEDGVARTTEEGLRIKLSEFVKGMKESRKTKGPKEYNAFQVRKMQKIMNRLIEDSESVINNLIRKCIYVG